MITSVKKFGSYVLTKNNLYLDDIHDKDPEPTYVSSCSLPSHWIELPLLRVIPYNHDTSLFRFALPVGASKLGLPPGSFLLILAPGCEHDGSDAIRPYTSVSDDEVQNNANISSESVPSFDIMCKRYDEWGKKENLTMNFLYTKTDHSYKPAGAVSNYLHRLKVGEKVKFKRKTLYYYNVLV
jgi:NAD(P)H-flavin reductase